MCTLPLGNVFRTPSSIFKSFVLGTFSFGALLVSMVPSAAYADPIPPFGAASAYNVVALGSVDAQGNTLLTGNISDNSDITGRVAASGMFLQGTTIGSDLGTALPDPFGSMARFDFIAAGGIASGLNININGTGNAYAPGALASEFNFNGKNGVKGSLITTGSPGLDFNALRTSLDSLSVQIATLASTGTILTTNPPGVNSSNLVLKGTSATLNIFNLTSAQFSDADHPIDIEAPVGSTIIINVSGPTAALGTALLYNEEQHSANNSLGSNILFNFSTATSVAINAQFDASILSPFALLTGSSQMDGTYIAAQVGQLGQVHNEEFAGILADPLVTPEPGTLTLLTTGLAGLTGFFRRRGKACAGA